MPLSPVNSNRGCHSTNPFVCDNVAGLADPVYAEAYVTVHQYDIVLDVTVINRTEGTMQVGHRFGFSISLGVN